MSSARPRIKWWKNQSVICTKNRMASSCIRYSKYLFLRRDNSTTDNRFTAGRYLLYVVLDYFINSKLKISSEFGSSEGTQNCLATDLHPCIAQYKCVNNIEGKTYNGTIQLSSILTRCPTRFWDPTLL